MPFVSPGLESSAIGPVAVLGMRQQPAGTHDPRGEVSYRSRCLMCTCYVGLRYRQVLESSGSMLRPGYNLRGRGAGEGCDDHSPSVQG